MSLSLGRAGEGGGGSRGGGHLSRRMLLLERPFLPRFLCTHETQNVLSERSTCDTTDHKSVGEQLSSPFKPNAQLYSAVHNLCWMISAWQQDYSVALGVVYSYIIICFWFCSSAEIPLGGDIFKNKLHSSTVNSPSLMRSMYHAAEDFLIGESVD